VGAFIPFHPNLRIATDGCVGVDVFVVINGYLISSNMRHEMSPKNFTFVSLYQHRIRGVLGTGIGRAALDHRTAESRNAR